MFLKRMKQGLALAALALFGAAGSASAAGMLSPAGGHAPLELVSQDVDVTIQNGYATTAIEQVFRNGHSVDLEARYSFPVPKEAVVGEFSYWIDGIEVQAEVLERGEARALYDQQKSEGREAALVEKDEYRSFDIVVTPVLAGQDVRTRLVYLQKESVDHALGRYVYPLADGGVDEEQASFWQRRETVEEHFSFNLTLRSAYPVDAVRVPNGTATVNQLDSGEWEVSIVASKGSGAMQGSGLSDREIEEDLERSAEPVPGSNPHTPSAAHGAEFNNGQSTTTLTRSGGSAFSLSDDIIVYWRLAENLPGAVDMVSFREPGASEGTFMLTLTPGIDLAPITEGRDWIFVLDTSGSMTDKFAALIDGMNTALNRLKPSDRFRIYTFSDHASELTTGFTPADAPSVQAALQRVGRLQADGGTNLYDGLRLAQKATDADRTAAVILVTDGVANVGPRELKQLLDKLEPIDVRLFTAVMGNSANEPLLQGLTEHAEGFAVNISQNEDIVGMLALVESKVTHESLHDIDVRIDGVSTRAITPEAFTRVYRGEQLVMFGKYRGQGDARLTLSARISGEPVSYTSPLVFPEVDTTNPELERLWAFASIKDMEARERLLGETDDTQKGIRDMALAHGLVTDQTSLVVVRDEVFEKLNIERNNRDRVERERLAREQRARQAIVDNRQDTQEPAFSAPRHTLGGGGGGGGGGSFSGWLLATLGLFALIRLWLECRDRIGGRSLPERDA